MNNPGEILKEQSLIYIGNEYSDELELIENQNPPEVRKEWSSQTTLWMMLFALLLWLITYLMVMTIAMCFDVSFRSMANFNGMVRWYNASFISNDDHTKFLIAY